MQPISVLGRGDGPMRGRAILAYGLSLAAIGVGDSLVEIFLVGRTDAKWGSQWGNLVVALGMLGPLVIGALVAFVFVVQLARGHSWARYAPEGVGTACGAAAWWTYQSGVASSVADRLGLGDAAALMTIALLPGVVAAFLYLAFLAVAPRLFGSGPPHQPVEADRASRP